MIHNTLILPYINYCNIHWASKETYHFFRATITKIHFIKINHIWTQISYCSPNESHLKNLRVSFVKKEKNAVKLQIKGHFKKITETARWKPPRKAACSQHSIAIHSISKADYVTAVLAIVRSQLRAVFCDFWKMTSSYSIKRLLFEMFLVRSTIAYLCSIMIHFNALDFKVSLGFGRSD